MYSLNGQLFSHDEFSLSPANRAFRYGDGVFETIRVTGGRVLWSPLHFARVTKAAATLHLNLGENWSLSYFEEVITALAIANHGEGCHARVRFSLFREDGGLYAPITNNAAFLIASESMDQGFFDLNNKGLLIDIYPEIRKPGNMLSGLKSINAQLYVLASIYKRDKDLGDIILLNEAGYVAEASSSNIFLVKGGHLHTTAPDQGAVEGIMRQVIWQLAADQEIPVQASPILPEDLLAADEIFLTNAIQGIRWVMGFRQKRYYNSFSRKMMTLLNDRVRTFLEEEV